MLYNIIIIILLSLLIYLNLPCAKKCPIKQEVSQNTINLELIKNKFNINKCPIYFNPASIPVKVTNEKNEKNITHLFNVIFYKTIVKLLDIVDYEQMKTEKQIKNKIIFNTNIGLILLIIISEKEESDDIFNNNEKNLEKNYLITLEKIQNYSKKENKKNINYKDIKKMREENYIKNLGIDLNPKVKFVDFDC